jgi:putative protease
VYEVVPRGDTLELGFARDAIDFARLRPGQAIWKTDDPKLTARLRKTFVGGKPHRRVPLDITVQAIAGAPLQITCRAENGAFCTIESSEPLSEATKHPLTESVLREQLGRLGNTVYELRSLTAQLTGHPMAPLSVLGKLRHEIIAKLTQSLNLPLPPREGLGEGSSAMLVMPTSITNESPFPTAPPRLRILCRSLAQLSTALDYHIDGVYVDFPDIRDYREAVAIARVRGAEIFLATPRIQKPDEFGIFLALTKHGANGLLVRNLAGIAFCAEREIPFICDFSLNAANEWTVEFLRSLGAMRVTASYDLNRDQLLDLVAAVQPTALEVVIHQHMPMFHMEHCVFCAVLSPGTNKHNCGRPCDVHAVKLRDRVGMEHPLTADVGCRNTLFNAVPQSAAEVVPQLMAKGVRDVRLEFLDDRGQTLGDTINLYRDLLAGRITGQQVWQRLKASNRVGVTRGTLEERRNPLAII